MSDGTITRFEKAKKAAEQALEGQAPSRDLIERAREVCQLRQLDFQLNADVLNTAWLAYFGDPAENPPAEG